MILGIDFSTRAIHGALIPFEPDNGEPDAEFRHYSIPKSSDPLNRYYQARLAMRELCADHDGYAVHLVIVEQPMGRFSVRPLWAMFGAIVSSVPGVAAVTAIEPQAWRRELGLPARMAKDEAVLHAAEWLVDNAPNPWPMICDELSEHSAEALLIALAGRQQNNRAWSEGAA